MAVAAPQVVVVPQAAAVADAAAVLAPDEAVRELAAAGAGAAGAGAAGAAAAGAGAGRAGAPVDEEQNPTAPTTPQNIQARLGTTTEMLNISFSPNAEQKKTLQAHSSRAAEGG